MNQTGFIATVLALLALSGCAGTPSSIFATPVATETLDGNYRTLSACTFDRLVKRQAELHKTVPPDQPVVRIGPSSGEWVLSFADEESGRMTRLEMKSPGTQASDYALAIARACSA